MSQPMHTGCIRGKATEEALEGEEVKRFQAEMEGAQSVH